MMLGILGHSCHHASDGCSLCKMHYCCVCMQTAVMNVAERGAEHHCKCAAGFWSTFCKEDNFVENLVFGDKLKSMEYPHDVRCRCLVCPECRPGNPCGSCPGNCLVCRDLIQPGPQDCDSIRTWGPQTEEQKAIMQSRNSHGRVQAVRRNPDLGLEAIHIAARDGDCAAIRREIAENNVHVDFADHVDGSTALHWASGCNQMDAVRLLLHEYGANVDVLARVTTFYKM